MKIYEIFESIQGEGELVGIPMLFIRMSGCDLKCDYCDSKYHQSIGNDINVGQLTERINLSNKDYICWTGGEPTLQIRDIRDVIVNLGGKYHSLETNGTQRKFNPFLFDHIIVSPKDEDSAEYWSCKYNHISIKIVTDLKKVNINLIEYADYLMPLTTFNKQEDERIKKNVWNYCIKHNIKYSPRLQIDLWQNERCG